MQINAVTDENAFSISAAIDRLPPNIKRLMASAGVDLAGKKISVGALDAQLRAAERITTHERLMLKVSLNHSGLLV